MTIPASIMFTAFQRCASAIGQRPIYRLLCCIPELFGITVDSKLVYVPLDMAARLFRVRNECFPDGPRKASGILHVLCLRLHTVVIWDARIQVRTVAGGSGQLGADR